MTVDSSSKWRSPAPVRESSSSGEFVRAKSLSHAPTVAGPENRQRALAPKSESENVAERDSVNFRAAMSLAKLRDAADLTLEEVAELTGEDRKTIWARESAKVKLGPLRQYLKLVEYVREKTLKGEE